MKSARFHSGAVAGSDAYDAAAEGSDAAACRDSQVVARPPHPRDRGSAIPGAGVSWGALQSFCEAHQADLQGRSTRQVRDLIKSLTTFRRCSYADYLDNPVSESESETVGPATVFVSHAWSRPFLELIDCIGNWLGQQDHKARVRQRFWLDLMVVSQHLDDPSEADAQVAAADARRRDPAALRRQAMCGNGNCDSGGETRAMKGEDGFSGGADGTQAINV